MNKPIEGLSSSLPCDPQDDLSSFHQTDLEVLRLLGVREGIVAFQGLRRRLNMHQEKLSRSLHRLETEGLVEKTPRGYLLSPKGLSLAQRWFLPEHAKRKTILRAFLPGDVNPSTVVEQLEGRWLGSLRWLGLKEENGGTSLRWVIENTSTEVALRVEWGRITLDTDAESPIELALAFAAAQQLFVHIVVPWKQELEHQNAFITA